MPWNSGHYCEFKLKNDLRKWSEQKTNQACNSCKTFVFHEWNAKKRSIDAAAIIGVNEAACKAASTARVSPSSPTLHAPCLPVPVSVSPQPRGSAPMFDTAWLSHGGSWRRDRDRIRVLFLVWITRLERERERERRSNRHYQQLQGMSCIDHDPDISWESGANVEQWHSTRFFFFCTW